MGKENGEIKNFDDMKNGEITKKKKKAAKALFKGKQEGKTYQEIAEEADCSTRYLRKLRKQKSFWNIWHKTFDEELEMLLPKVVDQMSEALDKENRESTQTAKMIMNALGLTEPEGGDNQTIVAIQRPSSDNNETEEEKEADEIVNLDGEK